MAVVEYGSVPVRGCVWCACLCLLGYFSWSGCFRATRNIAPIISAVARPSRVGASTHLRTRCASRSAPRTSEAVPVAQPQDDTRRVAGSTGGHMLCPHRQRGEIVNDRQWLAPVRQIHTQPQRHTPPSPSCHTHQNPETPARENHTRAHNPRPNPAYLLHRHLSSRRGRTARRRLAGPNAAPASPTAASSTSQSWSSGPSWRACRGGPTSCRAGTCSAASRRSWTPP